MHKFYYLPWHDIVAILHRHGLPLAATHNDTLTWLETRLTFAADIEEAIANQQAIAARIEALEAIVFGDDAKEFGE